MKTALENLCLQRSLKFLVLKNQKQVSQYAEQHLRVLHIILF